MQRRGREAGGRRPRAARRPAPSRPTPTWAPQYEALLSAESLTAVLRPARVPGRDHAVRLRPREPRPTPRRSRRRGRPSSTTRRSPTHRRRPNAAQQERQQARADARRTSSRSRATSTSNISRRSRRSSRRSRQQQQATAPTRAAVTDSEHRRRRWLRPAAERERRGDRGRGRHSRARRPVRVRRGRTQRRSTARVSRRGRGRRPGVYLPHSAAAQYASLAARAARRGAARRHHLLRQLRPPRRASTSAAARSSTPATPDPVGRCRSAPCTATTPRTAPSAPASSPGPRYGFAACTRHPLRGGSRARRTAPRRATRPPSWSSSIGCSPSMRRVARMFVSTDAVADECVQEAWLGVLQGLDRFEGRSSLRTWIFRILVNIAKTRGPAGGPERAVRHARGRRPRRARPGTRARFDATRATGPTLPFDWRGLPEERRAGGRDARA